MCISPGQDNESDKTDLLEAIVSYIQMAEDQLDEIVKLKDNNA